MLMFFLSNSCLHGLIIYASLSFIPLKNVLKTIGGTTRGFVIRNNIWCLGHPYSTYSLCKPYVKKNQGISVFT